MLFTLTNKNGAEAVFSSIGARIVSLHIPNKEGELVDVVQGFDTEDEYAEKGKTQGAICGRYANRIANAQFEIDGEVFTLEKNNGEHCLHSGNQYLRLVDYKGEAFGKQVHFVYHSEHLEAGFPGNVKVEITYTLTDNNGIKIHLCASTDQATHINLTSHPYFNLNGEGNGTILGHHLHIESDFVLEIDETGIPTGHKIDVSNTGFDFKEQCLIEENMQLGHPQIEQVGGYDHCYVARDYEPGEVKYNGHVVSPETNIILTVKSTYPGIQLYTANKEKVVGKHGNVYNSHSAICLEPQFFPDSPNQPDFPSTLLKPKEKFNHTIIYQFSLHE